MDILFVCGSAEAGKDGVGDYTRRLCAELLHRKHDVRILALCDNQSNFFVTESQLIGKDQVTVYRIPAATDVKQRFTWTKQIVNDFQPDWISLQFVPYSFNPKGLPFWLPSFLKNLKGNHKLHIMFHELWIGMDLDATIKSKCIGLMQKTLISKILKTKEKVVIHTQTDLYKSKISKLGYNAQILPLFSNIAKSNEAEHKGMVYHSDLRFCVFGNIHYGAPVEQFIYDLKLVLSISKEIRTLKFVFIGNCGAEIEEWKKVLKANEIRFEETGFVNDFEISEILSSCQYGISTTPYLLNQKSGSLASMFDHELAVLCVARKWDVRGFKPKVSSNLMKYENHKTINSFLDRKFTVLNDNNLEFVATKFLSGLN
ncbi:hypothetical protein [Flavobacterium quisquiliarum]|uniref:Uncharacterized protein n=1 Tax=Flavobacterium quisquiliarum TaxID=1834436 RepID=A0ABV8W2S3_9FLAO|nr:hypothetical protein [Flavobacterium quisquiliarum]MBW1655018.1 hypothetical protein [Flavobacterium quisquiliarum]NWL02609.1 hypothetical protein [Flavobacterium collinsii]